MQTRLFLTYGGCPILGFVNLLHSWDFVIFRFFISSWDIPVLECSLIRALYLLKRVISLWAMLMDSIMFCIDVARETREGSLVFFSSSLIILNWFKSPCNSSSGFSWFNWGFGSSDWFVSFLS